MDNFYTVTEYIGDAPIPNQLFWGEKFRNNYAADFVAFELYVKMTRTKYANQPAYYVLVEWHTDDSGLGQPTYVISSKGAFSGKNAEIFCEQYE